MIIEQITPKLAAELCRGIAGNLPEYFGLPEANESYAQGVQKRTNFAVKAQEEYVGLLSLDFPYPKTASIYWLGLLQSVHGKGMGRSLVHEAEKTAREKGAEFMTVETLSVVQGDENYKNLPSQMFLAVILLSKLDCCVTHTRITNSAY